MALRNNVTRIINIEISFFRRTGGGGGIPMLNYDDDDAD